MKKLLFSKLFLLFLVACGESEERSDVSSLERLLETNESWPYEVVGVLDIVEAGGYEESEYPSWAVGMLTTDDTPNGIGIEIGDGVVSRARINIDSGKKVRVWLEAPHNQYGDTTYPVSKIKPL